MEIRDILSNLNYDNIQEDSQACPLCGHEVRLSEKWVFGKAGNTCLLTHQDCTDGWYFEKSDIIIKN